MDPRFLRTKPAKKINQVRSAWDRSRFSPSHHGASLFTEENVSDGPIIRIAKLYCSLLDGELLFSLAWITARILLINIFLAISGTLRQLLSTGILLSELSKLDDERRRRETDHFFFQ
jgi:hypothetical protein